MNSICIGGGTWPLASAIWIRRAAIGRTGGRATPALLDRLGQRHAARRLGGDRVAAARARCSAWPVDPVLGDPVADAASGAGAAGTIRPATTIA